MAAVDWQTLKASLPVGLSAEDKQSRKELWAKFSVRKGRYLALFEVDAGIQKVLGCEELFNAKAVIQKAYMYAREVNPAGSPDKVDFSEFRLLLCYVSGLFDVYQIFKTLDQTKDNALDLDELENAKAPLAAAGVRIENPGALWSQLRGTNDYVDFHEFSDWAIRQSLGGQELLEKAEALDQEEAEALKQQLLAWDLCIDGAITRDDFRAIMHSLDSTWTAANFDNLCTLEGVPIQNDKVLVSEFIDFLCQR